jgi:DNA-binding beta-propeller fold protein YncE
MKPIPRPRQLVSAAKTLALAIALACPAAGLQLHFVEAEFDGAGGVDGLDGAHAVVVSPDGAHVYVASDGDGAVAVLARTAGGPLTFIEMEKDGVGGVDGLDGAEHLALDPSGSHLYVAGLLDGAVAVFARNAGSGELSFVEAHFDGDPGIDGIAGASWVAVSPDGLNVYVAGRFDDAVAVFQRNPTTGELTFLEVETDGQGGADGLADVTSVAVSPDGDHLYAAGQGDQLLAIFSRGAMGALTFVGSIADALPDGNIDVDDHRSLSFSPDGDNLYVANHVEDLTDGWIATFARNAATGLLTLVPPVLLGDAVDNCLLGIEGDSGLAVSPDGTVAYANLTFDASLVMFARSPATGALAVIDSECDETLGMSGNPGELDGLWGAQGVAVSPDGRNVYVASGNIEDAVAVFAEVIFADGFESGTTKAWSSAVP